MPRLRWLKGTALARLGRDDDVERELSLGIALFEQRLLSLTRETWAASYADEGWNLYQLLIDHYTRHGRANEALQVLERIRSDFRLPTPPVLRLWLGW